jgi:acyl-coenzyme A thioesterase PaaI-like protein
MKNLLPMLHKAKTSRLTLRCLNAALSLGIPFNRAHKFKIASVEDDAVTCFAPNIRKNHNHLRGVHACGIATVGEFSAGMTLMLKFSPEKYRVIMSQLEVKYHYQGRQDLLARSEISLDLLDALLLQLQEQDSINHAVITEVHDQEQNHVASITTHWQIKPWTKVKLKKA